MYTKTPYFQITLVLLFLLLFSLKSCTCKNEKTNNNSGTDLSPEQPEVIKNNCLLSAQLKDKKFQDIFTEKKIKELNLGAHEPIFLEQDSDKNIYQIKVLGQKGLSCGYHSIKNYVWLMKALNSDFNKFNEYYSQILSKNVYEDYQNSTTFPPQESIEPYEKSVIDKIKNKQVKGLPEESGKYIEDFVEIIFSKYDSKSDIQSIEEEAKKIIPSIEGSDPNTTDRLAYEVCVLNRNNALIEKLHNLNLEFLNNPRFIHGFNLSVWTSMDHAICLIINKDKENIEYILADSLNKNFKSDFEGRYLQAIETLKSFISQKGYLEKMILRYIYVMVSFYAEKAMVKKSRIFQKFLPKLNEFNLKNCDLYNNTYKQHFIDLIKKYKKQDKDEAEVYKELLRKL